jgi:alkylated DNA repair dioxygenase AlkB
MTMSKKRTLDSFFLPSSPKRPRLSTEAQEPPEGVTTNTNDSTDLPTSNHHTYPYPIPHFPTHITNALSEVPATEGKEINNQPDLDLLYFQPYIPKSIENDLFKFLRQDLFFYRVQYQIKRFGTETQINTPRYTTVFGVDETSKFSPNGFILDTNTSKPIPKDRYPSCQPRPLPHCLDELRKITEVFTGATYNFCLVNYYATGADSISYHSDDERFLGPNPSIASFSLGAKRDFLMKHKAVPPNDAAPPPAFANAPPLKLALASGDMVLMRGKTQANWLHSIPKRKGGEAEKGRINITFRKALVKGGTENYYHYNVGGGGVWKWDRRAGEMKPWSKGEKT